MASRGHEENRNRAVKDGLLGTAVFIAVVLFFYYAGLWAVGWTAHVIVERILDGWNAA